MPTPGLSLVGLLPDSEAMDYFAAACVFPPGTDLVTELAAARAKLTGRIGASAGLPNVAAFPAAAATHEAAVRASARFRQFFAPAGYEFRMVEIAPTLACQAHVTVGSYSAGTDAMTMCLPTVLPNVPFTRYPQGGEDYGSMLITSDDLNVRILTGGSTIPLPAEELQLVGVGVGVAAPYVQVLRWDGRCYLTNGFHRAYALLLNGQTEMPCLYREIDNPDPATFVGQPFSHHLRNAKPSATLGDFLQGYPVPLKRTRREINVSWSQVVLPVE